MEATRRSVFAGLAGLATLATPLVAVAQRHNADMEFIRTIQGLHDSGGLAAHHAIAAGMRPEWLFAVMLGSSRLDDPPGHWPALLFGDGQKNYRFRPTGLDH